ncbi:efflux RND transporter permease subunit [candidate division KSB1 bacterium]|nr:efflux RND transporter permease subunit [candidate division KSB1 bacterium]
MKTIIKFFVLRPMLATLLSFMILLLGINRLLNIRRSIYPHVDMGIMNILTHYPGASAEDVELNVTNNIENAIEDIGGIDHITSISMENLSTIDIYINVDAHDKENIKDRIRDAVLRVSDLPDAIEGIPLITEMNTAEIDVIEIGIIGDISYSMLRDYSKKFESKLNKIPGIVRLDRFGFRAREVKIEVSPYAMENYQLSFKEIIHAIRSRNIKGTNGTFMTDRDEKDIVTLAQFENPKEVADIIVRTSFNGPAIRLKDLARIKDDYEEESLLSRINGKPAISFLVFLDESSDVIRTCDSIKEFIRKEQIHAPDGISLEYVNDESRYVKNSFNIVFKNGLLGLGLVLLILPLFLSIRTAFWVAIGIPISLLGTIFLLPFFGLHLDTIGLTGMILVLGIIVDDSIIISENIIARRESGMSPSEAVINGTQEVFLPVATTVFTTLVVFIPMLFLPGIMGASMIPIPVTIILALIISLLESSFALPAHLLPGIKKMKKKKEDWFIRLSNIYEKLMVNFLKFRYLIIILFIVLFTILVWLAYQYIKFTLFPTSTAEHVLISNELPVGTPLKITSEKTKEIEKILSSLPENEIDSYSTRIGLNPYISGMHGALSRNYAIISLNLTPFTERKRSTDEIVEQLRTVIDKLKNQGDINFSIVGTAPPVGKPVSLRIVGNDDFVREILADSVVSFLEQIKGVKDITRDDKIGKEQVEIELNYERLARLGLTVEDVTENVRIGFEGQIATTVRFDDEDVDFRVLLEQNARSNYNKLFDMLIPNKEGRLIRLREFGTLVRKTGIANRKHFDGERAISIEADIDQYIITAMEVTNAVFRHFDVDMDYPGISIAIAGELFETERSMASLTRAFIIGLIAIYFLLVLLFKNLSQPFLVMAAIPFGLMGVCLTFILHNEPFSFVAIMGIIGLIGVVVNDSLVLVDHINGLRTLNPETQLKFIIAQGTANRLRAVILTSLTTIIAIIPLAYGLGGTSPFMAPLALALGWGLVFATPLSLLLVPNLYLIREDILGLFKVR